MDRVSKLLLFIMPMMGIYSCDEDVDGITPGDFNFIIVNGTQHQITITTDPISFDIEADTICLSYQDSFVSKGAYYGIGDPDPFPVGDVYISFDDSLVHECQSNFENRCMIFTRMGYERLQDGPDVYKYRYVITEEDYEYAKAHPYTGEK